ncbi:stage II sporulation protein R [Tumebacillus permanentifrigoris]|uniref:Stage II sporulation protein R n=1 Tax=Tumebacillus permanentifrigoris TaxID=378543 RepID=A0A316DDJ0_9BACL|nr:stage II sporulation protein R [Tumebacillus permanentifrigoris]PWK16291.1 stage II sporulation protein R [Tumebacillus permanentifrigoris]
MRKGLVLATVAVSMFLTGVGYFNQSQAVAQAQDLVVAQPVIAEDGTDVTDTIPGDAIRLRIIANSDDPADQKLKRDVRDQIIVAVADEIRGLKDHDAIKATIANSVPEMNDLAAKIIAEKGYSYPVQTDYGNVPFPTKMYGDKVYPAGEYEALRIQIGEAAGQNWWCVLFPPLCFVDMANGDAVAQPKDMEGKKQPAPITTVDVKDSADGHEQEVEVRSALVDKLSEWWDKIFA